MTRLWRPSPPALAARLELLVAVRLANIAAGIVVGKVGTAVAREADLLGGAVAAGRRAAQDRHARGGDRARAALAPQGLARRLHQRLLRPAASADLQLLEEAREACDRLVVGLDFTGQPTQAQAARAAMLASLASVDLVTVFADESPAALIEALRPDMVVKNAG